MINESAHKRKGTKARWIEDSSCKLLRYTYPAQPYHGKTGLSRFSCQNHNTLPQLLFPTLSTPLPFHPFLFLSYLILLLPPTLIFTTLLTCSSSTMSTSYLQLNTAMYKLHNECPQGIKMDILAFFNSKDFLDRPNVFFKGTQSFSSPYCFAKCHMPQ